MRDKLLVAGILVLGSAMIAMAGSPVAKAAQGAPVGSVAQECANPGDPEQLCAWSGAAGSTGRACNLDVEKIHPDETCNFDKPPRRMDDHKPMCISVERKEHISFYSGKKRAFRVRRLIRVTPTNPAGQACPAHPFKKHFDPTLVAFGTGFDTTEADTSQGNPTGCVYKLEVQFDTIDPKAPGEPNDKAKRHFECRDPHVKVSQ